MSRIGRSTWASLLVILFGTLLLAAGTDGFRAYTAEAARMIRLNDRHPAFPDITLQDSTGRLYKLSEWSGKHVLVTFIYTSCGTVCPQIERNMAAVFDRLPREKIGSDIVFLSISFDTDRDTPEALEAYRRHFIDDPNWRTARVPDGDELERLLNTLGVIVIRSDNGDIAHNRAFYLIDRQGKLAEIMDDTNVDLATDKIERRIGKGAEA